MPLTLPEIPEAENTPLVRQLLEIICTQQDRIQQLEDEILRLKGLKTRPVIAPSPLEPPPRPPSSTSALFVAPRTPIFPGFSRMVARLFANPRGPVGFQELKNTSFFQAFLVTRDY